MHVPGQRPESEAVLVAALGALGDSPPRAVSEVCLLVVVVLVAVVDSRVGAAAEGRVGGVPTYPNQNP